MWDKMGQTFQKLGTKWVPCNKKTAYLCGFSYTRATNGK